MFTGIIEEIGTILFLRRLDQGLQIGIKVENLFSDVKRGDSISINGVCLTVVSLNHHSFVVEAVTETLDKSNLRYLNAGQQVNLERALRPTDRLGGHIVQGHVDGIGKITQSEKQHPGFWLTIECSEQLVRYLVEKGSIAVNGISLTIASIKGNQFSVSVIPYTANMTTLGQCKVGDYVNLEVDIISKYVERLMSHHNSDQGLTLERLQELGF